MKTNRPISTISYNSDSFLKYVLDDLIKKRIIDFYAFINHLPEPKDEYGFEEKKKHKHLFIFPSQIVDTNSEKWQKVFEEVDSKNVLPLKCIHWEHSKFIDWFLYALHDSAYLALKGQTRAYHYKVEDIICSDTEYMMELYHTSDVSKVNQFNLFRELCSQNITFKDMLKSGFIPVQQIRAYERAYQLLTGDIFQFTSEKDRLYKEGWFEVRPVVFEGTILRSSSKIHE